MKFTAFTTICFYYISVLIPIQSELIYVYNYDNFGDIFHQGNRNDFNVYKYEDIDSIFETKYAGTNIGGAFQMLGNFSTATHQFDGYLVDVTATIYCANTEERENWLMWFKTGNNWDAGRYVCGESPVDTNNWNYNIKWIPYFDINENVTLHFESFGATVNKPFGFDEIRVTTRETPPDNTNASATSGN